ncbi:MAG: hypothetical protein CMI01_02690 [Oceanospirillaceae bacterium]|nr:hypothetical protein [Oceanospirillaceae bacterium]
MRGALCLLFALWVAGCQTQPQQAGQLYQRGMAIIDQDGMRFRPCHGSHWHRQSSLPDALLSFLDKNPNRALLPIYLEGWGDQQTSGDWQLSEARVVGGTLSSCARDLPGVYLHAGGEGPGWAVNLYRDQLTLRLPERRQTLVFTDPDPMRIGHIWRWESRLESDSGRLDLWLEVREEPCFDQRGYRYHLKADLEFDHERFEGCARMGDLQWLALTSRYRTDPQYLRRLDLLLKEDGTARWVENNGSGQPLDARVARWQWVGRDRLLLEVMDEAGESVDMTLPWRISANGELRLRGYSPALGEGVVMTPLGLPLQSPGWKNLP